MYINLINYNTKLVLQVLIKIHTFNKALNVMTAISKILDIVYQRFTAWTKCHSIEAQFPSRLGPQRSQGFTNHHLYICIRFDSGCAKSTINLEFYRIITNVGKRKEVQLKFQINNSQKCKIKLLKQTKDFQILSTRYSSQYSFKF